MPLNIIGENLIIKDGVIVCRDGTQLKEYLAKFNFKDGDAVNVISNEGLKKLQQVLCNGGSFILFFSASFSIALLIAASTGLCDLGLLLVEDDAPLL